jgi:hypothetical protein
MIHFLNLISTSLLVYAAVTRGGLGVAKGLELIVVRSRTR